MKIHRIDHVGVNVIDLVSKMKQKGIERLVKYKTMKTRTSCATVVDWRAFF